MSATATKPLPVIVDPFSRSADEVAGETADKIALNLRACVRVSRGYRQQLQREARRFARTV
jgi:hypothetical protein